MFQPVIGLEIHIELKTRTKMFCGCLNDAAETKPNKNVCPICLGHPGVLPTINRSAVEAVLKLGLALKGKIAQESYFDRKSYFYPDLPKGYQISQYKKPLVEGGKLNDVRIRRIHLEEDTGRLLHAAQITDDQCSAFNNFSLIDFNRAGVPLMELVTEPDIKSATEAVGFAKELQLILRYLEISEADMEKGQLRIEANVSLSSTSNFKFQQLGTKVEVKNLNSFRALAGAIEYEIKRQREILEKKGKIIQETRGWDAQAEITKSQRFKESSHDYRYFPEPDLPVFELQQFDLAALEKKLPELPAVKRQRLIRDYGLTKESVEILVESPATAAWFEKAAAALKFYLPNGQLKFQTLVNYFVGDLRGLMADKKLTLEEIKINPSHFAHFIALIEKGRLSSRLAKEILVEMFNTGEDPEVLIKRSGVRLITNEEELSKIIKEVIVSCKKAVADYHQGKETALQFLIGQAMAKTRGQADPEKLKTLLIEELKK